MDYKVWGLFINGKMLVAQYDFTDEGYMEAFEDAKMVYQETGVPHTVETHTVSNK